MERFDPLLCDHELLGGAQRGGCTSPLVQQKQQQMAMSPNPNQIRGVQNEGKRANRSDARV